MTIEQLIQWCDLADGIVDITKDPLVVLNKDMEVVVTNQAFSALFKIPEQAYRGKEFLKLLSNNPDGADFKKLLKNIASKQRSFENIEWENSFSDLGSKKFSISGRKINLNTLGGKLVLLTLRDITREKELEENHMDSQIILESITDAFIAYDKTWHYTYVNKEAEKILGKKRRDLLGRIVWEANPDIRQTELGEKLRQAAREQKTTHFETFYPPRNKWYHFSIYPLKTGLTTYFRDINDEKMIEQQKDEFVSVISHELKTPITSISGFTQILIQKTTSKNDQESLKYLERIEFYTHRLTSLITGLLNSENLRAREFQFKDKVFSLDDLVSQTVEDLRQSIPTHSLIIRGKTRKQISADPERINQILINLILNAVRYSPNSNKVIISTRVKKLTAIIAIRDYGIGISKENQQHIFDRFFQVKSPKKELSSIGLGLDISAGIIKHYGGQIWVKSNEGQGSTFYFSLPLKTQPKTLKESAGQLRPQI